jgi:hypothetical protein
MKTTPDILHSFSSFIGLPKPTLTSTPSNPFRSSFFGVVSCPVLSVPIFLSSGVVGRVGSSPEEDVGEEEPGGDNGDSGRSED